MIGGKLVLITNSKSYMGFGLVPNSVTLNDPARQLFVNTKEELLRYMQQNFGSFGLSCFERQSSNTFKLRI